MTTIHRTPRRRLDLASLLLLLVGLLFGVVAYWLVSAEHYDALLLVPSVVAATLGASHLFKREAPRD